MPKTIALLRTPDSSITTCELTHMERDPINFEKLKLQHSAYAQTLESLGMRVKMIPELKGSADGVFVEDAALVLDELAIICRPGADSRKHETDSVLSVLSSFRKLIKEIAAPATLDGGDLLQVGRAIYVGLSSRTNYAAFEQLKNILVPFGYEVKTVSVKKCLHLKTGVCYLGNNTLLLNPEWIDANEFSSMKMIEVDKAEPFGANAIRFQDTVVHTQDNPLTTKKILAAGFKVTSVAISELAKAEAGLTCLSLIFGEEDAH